MLSVLKTKNKLYSLLCTMPYLSSVLLPVILFQQRRLLRLPANKFCKMTT